MWFSRAWSRHVSRDGERGREERERDTERVSREKQLEASYWGGLTAALVIVV